MADAFDEVEENIRRERLEKLFKVGWPYAAGLFVAVIAGIAGYSGYQGFREARAADAAAALIKIDALSGAGNHAGAAQAYQVAADTSPAGHAVLATMLRAGALEQAGDLPGALLAMDDAVAMAQDPLLRDSARLRAAMLAAGNGATFVDLQARVQPLIEERSIFAYQAHELLGMEAMKAGDLVRARSEFESVTLALEAPQGVRQRAEAALAYLGPAPAEETPPPADAADAPAAPAAAEGAPQ